MYLGLDKGTNCEVLIKGTKLTKECGFTKSVNILFRNREGHLERALSFKDAL